MKTLEDQYKEDTSFTEFNILQHVLSYLEIEERGGGPEGIYYTHPSIKGEFLFRNLHRLIISVISTTASYRIHCAD